MRHKSPVADTGQAIEVNISPTSSVQVLRESITSLVGIPTQDQILLVEGKRLESNKTLEQCGLPHNDKEVFLFNRKIIVDASFPMTEESVPPPVETIIPPIRPLSKEYESKPLIQALKTYEHQFHYQFVVAQAIREAYERRLYYCKMLFSEEHVQVRAIDCAVRNQTDHMGQLAQSFAHFNTTAKAQSFESDELLDGFDSDLAKLKEIQLHPSLAPPGTTLLDIIPDVRLREWARDGRRDNDHLKARIPDLEAQVRLLQHEVDTENRKSAEVDFHDLSKRLTHGDDTLNEITTKVQMFAKDFENVRTRVEAALRSMQAQNVGSFCDGFDEIAKVHETHLSFLKAQDEASKENFVVFARVKAKLSKTVYSRIRMVSTFQSRVRELHNSMGVLWEALRRLKAAFGQLAVVKNIPHGYQAALSEVSRRRQFVKKLQREIARMNETLAKLRQEENPKRESFINKYYSYVPGDLIPSLQEFIPPLEISLPAFDEQLPPIDSSSSSSHDDDDFTIVPFGDDTMPRMQSFDKDNTFNQSSSHSQTPYTHAASPPTSVPSSHSSSSPSTPISTTKGFHPVHVNTSGGGTPSHSSSSPSSTQSFDTAKLQKDLASAKEVAASYAERIKQLENELNKLYKERVEPTHISKIDPDTKNQLKAKDDIILSLRAELDSMRDKEKEPLQDVETENLRSKVFEQEQQIERLMTALASSPSSNPSHDPLVSSGKNGARELGELERVLQELEESKRAREEKEREWEVERKEALGRYEGMMKQLTGELDNLREEKLHTSRRWDNEKIELEKTQKNLESVKAQFTQEQEELEQKIQKLTEQIEKEKQEFEGQIKELESQLEVRSAAWDEEKVKLQGDIEEAKGQYCKLMDEKKNMEEAFRKSLGETQLALENLKEEKSNMDKRLEEVNRLLEEKEKELIEKTKKAEEADKLIAYSKQELRSMEARNLTLQKTTKDLETKIKDDSEKYASERTSLEEQIRILSIRSEQLEKDRVEIVSKSEELERKIRSSSEEYKSLKANYEDLVVQNEVIQMKAKVEENSLNEELDEMRTQLEVKNASLQERIAIIDKKNKTLQDQEASMREKDAALLELEANIREKDSTLLKRDSTLLEKETAINNKDSALREKEAIIRDKDAALLAKDTIISEKEAALSDKETIIAEKESSLRTKDATISEKDAAMREKDELLRTQDLLLREKEAASEEMSRSVASLLENKEKGHSEEMLDYERRMMMMEARQKQEEDDRYRMFELEREGILKVGDLPQRSPGSVREANCTSKEQGGSSQVATLKNDLGEKNATIAELQSRLKDQGIAHQQELAALASKYAKKESDITEISVQIQKKNAALEKRISEAEEEKQRLIQQNTNDKKFEGELNNLRQAISSVSRNLKDHIACKDLQYKEEDEISNFQMQVTALVAYVHGIEEERDEEKVRLVAEVDQHRKLLQVSETRRSDLDSRLTESERLLQLSKDHLSALQLTINESVPNKISFSKFKDGDLALFVPKGKFHEAFNINEPNYYLSEICIQIYENKTHICGQIIEINTRKATSSDNPFNLPNGTEFHERRKPIPWEWNKLLVKRY